MGCSQSLPKAETIRAPLNEIASETKEEPHTQVEDPNTTLPEPSSSEMSREVLDAQHQYPLSERALSMPALLRMVGKAWPEKGRRSETPSLAGLSDIPNPPRGIDGRLLRDMAVWEVVQFYIQPATAELRCSFITAYNSGKLSPEHAELLAPAEVQLEYWAAGDIGAFKDFRKDESLQYDYKTNYNVTLPGVAQTTWFVSHAWSRPWYELVDTIWQHYLRQPLTVCAPGHWNGMREIRAIPIFYWVDIWAVSQHFKGEFTKHPDADFPSVITSGRGVLLTLAPWTAPVTVSRVWCLYEISKALEAGKLLDTFPEQSFWGAEYAFDVATVQTLLEERVGGLDASNAKATVDADRAWIMAQIKETFGSFDAFNAAIRRPLRDRVLEVVFLRCLRTKNAQALAALEHYGVVLTVETLEMNFWDVGPECFQVLARVLAHSPAVHELKMPGNAIGNRGATALAAVLKAPGCTIRAIDAGTNDFTEEGVKEIAAGVAAAGKLEGICLDGNMVGDEAGEAMLAALQANTHVRLYFHHSTQYSVELRQRLQQDMWIETRKPKILGNGHPDGLGGLAP